MNVTATTTTTPNPNPRRLVRRINRGSAHANYSVSHHMVIKSFLLLGLAAEYKSRRCV